MKITFVMDGGHSLSGGHRAIATFADRLTTRGHDVALIVRPPPAPTLREQVRRLLRDGRWTSAPEREPSHLDGIGVPVKLIERRRPITDADVPDADLVLATWWETAEWVWSLSARKGLKLHFIQDYEFWGGPEKRVDAAYALPIPKIVTSAWLGGLLREKFNQTPLGIIPPGVDLLVFSSPPRGKPAVPTVGLTYSPLSNKGSDVSIEAYRRARGTIPDLRMVVCGNAPLSPELPLPDGAHYQRHARDSQLEDLYSQCDAWLFGSRGEGFGLPALEAMACGTPVIGTPAGAAPELLADGAGVLLKAEDPEDMARAIVEVCRMPDNEWREMSDAARARAGNYSWDRLAGEFEAVLRTAVSLL